MWCHMRACACRMRILRRAAAAHPACAALWWAHLPRHRCPAVPPTCPTVAPRVSRRPHARLSRCALSARLHTAVSGCGPDSPGGEGFSCPTRHTSHRNRQFHTHPISLALRPSAHTHTHVRTPHFQRPGWSGDMVVCVESARLQGSLVATARPSTKCIHIWTMMQ